MGLLRVEDVVSGEVMSFKCKSVSSMAHYINKQQTLFEWVCGEIGISVEDGLKLTTSDIKTMYEERTVEVN